MTPVVPSPIASRISVPTVHDAMDNICRLASEAYSGWVFRRAEAADLAHYDCGMDAILFFGILVTSTNEALSSQSFLTTFNLAYSTWDGRVLYLDRLGLEQTDAQGDQTFVLQLPLLLPRILCQLAVKLNCTRFVWHHYQPLSFPSKHQPHYLDGWLTLQWDTEAMRKFACEDLQSDNISPRRSFLSPRDIRGTIENVLQSQKHEHFRLRLADKDDVKEIGRLVRGLALFEKEPESVHISEDHYYLDGFGDHPLFYCILLDCKVESHEEFYASGMAFFFIGYKCDVGYFLYLEDLFIEESYRGNGGGTVAMKALAKIGVYLGCARTVWQALNWNSPALKFYDGIGAKLQNGLLTSRFAGAALVEFANTKE